MAWEAARASWGARKGGRELVAEPGEPNDLGRDGLGEENAPEARLGVTGFKRRAVGQADAK